MKLNKLTGAVIVCAFVLILAGWTISSQTSPRVQWEYETIDVLTVSKLPPSSGDVDRALATFGKGGYELITTEQYSLGGDNLTRLYFKRQRR
jgi:hypothetical protein